MENIIKKLIKIDLEAQKTTEQALAHRQEAETTIGSKKEELSEIYLEKAKRKCAAFEEEEEKRSAQLISAEKEKNIRIISKLDEAYSLYADKWTDEIVTAVIGE